MRASLVAFILMTVAALAEPRFQPAEVPYHAYDGGWEHFVGGGVGVLDCNGDGRPDMLAAGGSNPVTLFINRSDSEMLFDATPLDIVGSVGAYPIHLNGDAHVDLIVLRVGPDLALQGDGACGFRPLDLGIDFPDTWTTAFSATWEEGQSVPTLAFGHYVDRTDPDGPFEACDENHLYRPEPEGYARNVLVPGFCALSMLFTDWSRGGRADLRVSNDRHYYVKGGAEQLWEMGEIPRLYNQADGWKGHQLWGMGIAARDLDRDGRDEVFLSSMGDQRLQVQDGDGPTYVDVPFDRGAAAQRPYVGGDGRPSTGWHIAFGDIQNDGRDDVFISKGNVQQMPGNAMEDPNNLLIQNVGGQFEEFGDRAGVASLHRGRGAALVDFNTDGLLDLVVVNRRAPLELWRNVSGGTGHWLSVDLHQSGSNRAAVGAWIEVDDGTSVQSREITVGGGHGGGMLGSQHFGLGEVEKVRVRVRWPHGNWSNWEVIAADQIIRITPDGTDLSVRRY